MLFSYSSALECGWHLLVGSKFYGESASFPEEGIALNKYFFAQLLILRSIIIHTLP